MLKKLLCWSLIFSITAASAETTSGIGADTIILGKPGSSGPVKIKSRDGGFLKKNKNGDWLFSNDGILEKKMGSGSGSGGSSGINLLSNDSFEDGITLGWVSTGGTFSSQNFTNSSEGNLKYARLVASAAGQFVESNAIAIPDDFGAGCQADFKKYNTSTSNGFKIEAMNSTGTVIYATQVLASGSWSKAPTISFPCPVTGTLVKLRLTSLSAATIDFDKGYLGSNQNLVYTSQAKLFGTVKTAASANCVWVTSSTTFAEFPVDADCASAVASGGLAAPATKIPGFVIPSAPPGDYIIYFRGRSGSSGSSASINAFRFTDGNTVDSAQTSGVNAPGYESSSAVLMGKFSYGTTQTNLNIRLQSKITPGSPNASYIHAVETEAEFVVFYYPSSSDVAVSNEQSSWFIDANIGGANPDLGATAVTSYTEITNPNLDLVVNTLKGSAPAEIACASGTASSGLTCSSAESIGIAFNPLNSGRHEVCFTVSFQSQGVAITPQVVLTSNTSSAILEEGSERINIYGGTNSHFPTKLCSTFSFSDISKKTFRLMREQGPGAAASIQADRDSQYGQRDIHVTVRPLTQEYSRPILNGDTVTISGTNKPKIFGIKGTTTSGILTYNKGGVVTSCTAANPTVCSLTGLTSEPLCVAGPQSGISTYSITPVTSSSLTITSYNAATGALAPSAPFNIICFGE